MENPGVLLAIESSCDDTAAAIIINGKVSSNITSTQVVHNLYGGVVPELASRQHLLLISSTVETALREANVTKSELSAIAFTIGPGLMGSLLVGINFGKGLATALGIPIIVVNHLEGHIMSHWIEEPKPDFPFLCLTVSGGHTQIVKVTKPNTWEILGTTLDDAAGEAFDKAGKMMGLGYPSGPIIDKLADQGEAIFPLPTPQIAGYNFSFSGLKTALMYFIRDQEKLDSDFILKNKENLCASLRKKIVDILLGKLGKAAKETGIKNIGIAGGVSANSLLRSELKSLGEKKGWKTYIPKFEYCTDNAGMIAQAAWYKWEKKEFAELNITPTTK
jgi:N6-L-threonylcarbamoyladenine synthase